MDTLTNLVWNSKTKQLYFEIFQTVIGRFKQESSAIDLKCLKYKKESLQRAPGWTNYMYWIYACLRILRSFLQTKPLEVSENSVSWNYVFWKMEHLLLFRICSIPQYLECKVFFFYLLLLACFTFPLSGPPWLRENEFLECNANMI